MSLYYYYYYYYQPRSTNNRTADDKNRRWLRIFMLLQLQELINWSTKYHITQFSFIQAWYIHVIYIQILRKFNVEQLFHCIVYYLPIFPNRFVFQSRHVVILCSWSISQSAWPYLPYSYTFTLVFRQCIVLSAVRLMLPLPIRMSMWTK